MASDLWECPVLYSLTFLRCLGAPDTTKTSFARGIPPRPLLAIRPAQKPINRCDQQPAGPSHPVVDLFFLFFFRGSGRLFACRNARRLILRINSRAGLPVRARRLADPAILRTCPSPARRPAAARRPLPHYGAPTLPRVVPSAQSNLILIVVIKFAPVPLASGPGRRSARTG